jgi:hypothetical protein
MGSSPRIYSLDCFVSRFGIGSNSYTGISGLCGFETLGVTSWLPILMFIRNHEITRNFSPFGNLSAIDLTCLFQTALSDFVRTH